MVESKNIKEVVSQVVLQAVMVVMMALRDAKEGPQPTTTASHRSPQKLRHSRLILIKPVFNWSTQDRYVILLNFEMEVLNIIESKVFELS